ncbi:magnesium transporter, partial [bacterium]|nr:magnesium transporter [bacterium]
TDEELEVKGALSVVKLRLPWLLICLLGALLSGTIIHLFSYALEQVVALASFIPVITAMGGNAGLQSSTVVIRNLALGRIEGGSILRTALRELRVGGLLGLLSGLIVGLVAWALGGNPMLGAVVGAAMIGAIITATLMGAFMPLVFRKLGADPAVASGPFITTANDMIGLTIYLGLGMLLLRFLD